MYFCQLILANCKFQKKNYIYWIFIRLKLWKTEYILLICVKKEKHVLFY